MAPYHKKRLHLKGNGAFDPPQDIDLEPPAAAADRHPIDDIVKLDQDEPSLAYSSPGAAGEDEPL